MTQEPDTLNIPAYQRKRSLNAKAKKLAAPKITKKKKRTRKKKVEPRTEIAITSPLIEDIVEGSDLTPKKNKGFREMEVCGICDGYFEKIDVAIVQVTKALRVGDNIIFEKENGLFEQTIKSMQIDRKEVTLARAGSDIGLKVEHEPIVGAKVYKVIS